MVTKKTNRPGPVSLFRGKERKPVTLTLTPEHHQKVKRLYQNPSGRAVVPSRSKRIRGQYGVYRGSPCAET